MAVEKLPEAIVEANTYKVDGVAGATLTSTAIRNAVAAALEEAAAKEAVPAEAAGGMYVPGTYTAEGTGMGKVVVNVTVDENSITAVEIDGSGETPGIGSVAVEKLPEAIVEANTYKVDGVAGATLTSTAIRNAVAAALEEAAA